MLTASVGWSMALSDNLLSPNFFASQGALVNVRFNDALSWAQSPSLLADSRSTHLSAGTFLAYPDLNPEPSEEAARGAAVVGFTAPLSVGVFGMAMSMPLGKNVWVDTGSRESSALFGLSRISAFSLGLGYAFHFGEGWSAGFQVPMLFRSNTATDIYLVEENAWARARSGVMPYLGLQVGLKKELENDSHWSISYRKEQASKIEFSVKGEVDFASITLPLDASGFSEILFEPHRFDIQFQKKVSSWHFGAFYRWSLWNSAPKIGLVIDSEVPQMSTEASQINWQNQHEVSVSVAKNLGTWSPVASYRFRSKAITSSNDYWDYDEHIGAMGVHVDILPQEIWVTAAFRLHKLVGGGDLISVLGAVDWAL